MPNYGHLLFTGAPVNPLDCRRIFQVVQNAASRRSGQPMTVTPPTPSHLDRHLAVLAEVRLRSGQTRLGELEGADERVRRSIPQFRRGRLDLQQAYVGIARAAGPPHLIGLSPRRLVG